MLRVGRNKRVREEVRSSCDEEKVRCFNFTEEKVSKYESFKVFGTTCLTLATLPSQAVSLTGASKKRPHRYCCLPPSPQSYLLPSLS